MKQKKREESGRDEFGGAASEESEWERETAKVSPDAMDKFLFMGYEVEVERELGLTEILGGQRKEEERESLLIPLSISLPPFVFQANLFEQHPRGPSFILQRLDQSKQTPKERRPPSYQASSELESKSYESFDVISARCSPPSSPDLCHLPSLASQARLP